MKKFLVASVAYLAFIGCNNGGSGAQGVGDTTRQPDGATNSSVISTDTAAMNTNKMKVKKDSVESEPSTPH